MFLNIYLKNIELSLADLNKSIVYIIQNAEIMQDQIIKYFLGELDEDASIRLFDTIEKNESLKKEFVELQNLHALSQLTQQATDEVGARHGFRKFMQRVKMKRQRYVLRNIYKYAAIAILLISSTFFFTRLFYEVGGVEEMNSLYVPAGQRAQLTLQDGTVVWLNAHSTLKYPAAFKGKQRRVEITGEGYFDVAADKKKPFIVSTQDVEMQVLGTEFNVFSYPVTGYVKTDLVDGSLRVYSVEDENLCVTLKPNEQVTVKEGKMYLAQSVNEDYYLWKDGIYAFDNERLLDILEKLQLYYDVTIVVEDPEIFNVCYTGKFRQRDGIDEILKVLQKIHPFKIVKDKENNIITLKK